MGHETGSQCYGEPNFFFFNNLKHFTNTCSVKYFLLYMQGTNFCGFHDSTNTYIKNQLKFNVYFPLVVLQG